MSISRRAVLIGAGAAAATLVAGAAAVDEGVLPGRTTAFRLLGLDGAARVVPSAAGGSLESGSFVSAARLGVEVGWSIAWPPAAGGPQDSAPTGTPSAAAAGRAATGAPLPVAVVLHGYGGSHASAFGPAHLGLDRFLAAHVRAGGAPFALASIDGGNTYWHRRKTGEDAGEMVVSEFLPLLASKGLDVSRIGLLGWSMGGFGALMLPARLGRARVAGVAAESPAIWHTAAEAASIAFDSPADFAAHTVFGRQAELDGIAVRVDCGTGDGFFPAARDYVAGFGAAGASAPSGGFEPGAHDQAYWRRMAFAQLAHLGRHLA